MCKESFFFFFKINLHFVLCVAKWEPLLWVKLQAGWSITWLDDAAEAAILLQTHHDQFRCSFVLLLSHRMLFITTLTTHIQYCVLLQGTSTSEEAIRQNKATTRTWMRILRHRHCGRFKCLSKPNSYAYLLLHLIALHLSKTNTKK